MPWPNQRFKSMTPAPDGFFGTTITTFSSSERAGSVHTTTGTDALKLLRLPATSYHLTREKGVQFLFMLQDELRVELIDEVQVHRCGGDAAMPHPVTNIQQRFSGETRLPEPHQGI